MLCLARGLYVLLNTRVSWSQALPLSEEARAEFLIWNTKIQRFNGKNIWVGHSTLRVVYVTRMSVTMVTLATVHH